MPTYEEILAAIVRVEQLVCRTDVPTVVTARVLRITRVLRELLPRLSHLGLGSWDAYSVMATATDYLPEAVNAYLRLPRNWADTRPISNGKTSLMLLVEQLELLTTTVDELFDAAVRQDANDLVVHGLFLKERFAAGVEVENLTEQAGVQP
ncbi:MAG: hypothetical protein LBR20_04385 [Propionibacteriaceae bacterium]|jgi:hypothetical protein|nr:hypothetical protein [Propionibacteriaceae bacterium]